MHLIAAMRGQWELLLVMILSICAKAINCSTAVTKPNYTGHSSRCGIGTSSSYCLGWRVAVESNNIHGWRTVPTPCLYYIENYMVGGQYERELEMVMQQIYAYIENDIILSNNGSDAWILDVDDTCISNLLYYRGKRFGCDPYDPVGFKNWASKAVCPALSVVLGLYEKLLRSGLKVFLLTGRDELILGEATVQNLHNQGFIGYGRLILRGEDYRGQSAMLFKSEVRKKLVEEGYIIWGNVGDQWSDLTGDHSGRRTFKLPNPMYFVP